MNLLISSYSLFSQTILARSVRRQLMPTGQLLAPHFFPLGIYLHSPVVHNPYRSIYQGVILASIPCSATPESLRRVEKQDPFQGFPRPSHCLCKSLPRQADPPFQAHPTSPQSRSSAERRYICKHPSSPTLWITIHG